MFKRQETLLLALLLAIALVLPVVGETFDTVDPHDMTPPYLPHEFVGNVYIGNNPAPPGTVIEIRAEGIRTGIPGNPTTVIDPGKFGVWEYSLDDPDTTRMVAQGNLKRGDMLAFYVNGVQAGLNRYIPGEVTDITLRTPAAVPAPAVPTLIPTPAPTWTLIPNLPNFSSTPLGEWLALITLAPRGPEDYKISMIWISTTPANAQIYERLPDGNLTQYGIRHVSPTVFTATTPGEHTWVAVASGFRPLNIIRNITLGEDYDIRGELYLTQQTTENLAPVLPTPPPPPGMHYTADGRLG
jgi:hypothetical protein